MRTPSHSTSRTWLIRVGWLMLIWVTSIVTLGNRCDGFAYNHVGCGHDHLTTRCLSTKAQAPRLTS